MAGTTSTGTRGWLWSAAMKAGMITGERTLELLDMPEPVAAPGHAVVAIERCGVCGTDVSAYKTGGPYTPFLHGHEWCGHVVEAGDGVHLAVGDRVVSGAPEACGTCAQCRAGRPANCLGIMDLRGPGGEAPPPHGGFAPRIAIDARRLVPVPVTLSPEAAGQIEPSAVARHGVGRTPIGPDDLVVVQGCGPIGLVAVQLARRAGARHVVAVEPDEDRRRMATTLGADQVVAPGDEAMTLTRDLTRGLGADIVLDCAGSGAALDSAVALARTGGWVTMIGVSSLPVTVTPGLWLIREITVAASLAHTRGDFDDVIAMLDEGSLVVEPLHSATVGLDDLDAAMADLADADKGLLKVLVDPSL